MKGCELMNSQEELKQILDHNWLSVYDCTDSDEYNSINEIEEMLNGDEPNDDIK